MPGVHKINIWIKFKSSIHFFLNNPIGMLFGFIESPEERKERDADTLLIVTFMTVFLSRYRYVTGPWMHTICWRNELDAIRDLTEIRTPVRPSLSHALKAFLSEVHSPIRLSSSSRHLPHHYINGLRSRLNWNIMFYPEG